MSDTVEEEIYKKADHAMKKYVKDKPADESKIIMTTYNNKKSQLIDIMHKIYGHIIDELCENRSTGVYEVEQHIYPAIVVIMKHCFPSSKFELSTEADVIMYEISNDDIEYNQNTISAGILIKSMKPL